MVPNATPGRLRSTSFLHTNPKKRKPFQKQLSSLSRPSTLTASSGKELKSWLGLDSFFWKSFLLLYWKIKGTPILSSSERKGALDNLVTLTDSLMQTEDPKGNWKGIERMIKVDLTVFLPISAKKCILAAQPYLCKHLAAILAFPSDKKAQSTQRARSYRSDAICTHLS